MKKTDFTPILCALFAVIFYCQHAMAQVSPPTGLVFAGMASNGTLRGIHKVMEASLDFIKVNNKGVSYVDDKDQARVSQNIGFLIAEGITFGGADPTGFNNKTNRNAAFGNVNVQQGEEGGNLPNHAPAAKMKGRFYLSEELEFIGKASKETSGNFTETSSLYYLQIPVLFNYLYGLNNYTSAVHAGLGVYAAIGLFGKFKGDNFSQSVHFGSSADDDLKRMDYGIAINAGYMFLKHWDVNLTYDLGLRNVSTTPPDPDTHVRGFSLKVGFWIN